MNPDVLGFTEMENDGYGASSAIATLVEPAQRRDGAGDVCASSTPTRRPGRSTRSASTRSRSGSSTSRATVTPVGQTAALNSVEFVNGGDGAPRNRPALAQAFEENDTGARFIAVVNHLKSKGSACDTPDAGDGQGNCNEVRVNAATELVGWLATDPTGVGDPDVLLDRRLQLVREGRPDPGLRDRRLHEPRRAVRRAERLLVRLRRPVGLPRPGARIRVDPRARDRHRRVPHQRRRAVGSGLQHGLQDGWTDHSRSTRRTSSGCPTTTRSSSGSTSAIDTTTDPDRSRRRPSSTATRSRSARRSRRASATGSVQFQSLTDDGVDATRTSGSPVHGRRRRCTLGRPQQILDARRHAAALPGGLRRHRRLHGLERHRRTSRSPRRTPSSSTTPPTSWRSQVDDAR